MALAKAYSSITITDATDVGRISLYITSSLPQTVIENPNEATTVYTPDWSKTNLVLTPIMYFNDQQLTLPKTGLTVTWKRQEGSSAPTDLKTGETVKDGVLTVSQNFLGTIQSGILLMHLSKTNQLPCQLLTYPLGQKRLLSQSIQQQKLELILRGALQKHLQMQKRMQIRKLQIS